MAGTQSPPEGYAEAVIISGPRKGEFITVPEGDLELTPAEAAMLDQLVEGAKRLAENARAAAAEANAILAELRLSRLATPSEPPQLPGS
jgi:hypothetical protein